MELQTVRIENPGEMNFILGQSHFIKTVEVVCDGDGRVVPEDWLTDVMDVTGQVVDQGGRF